MSIDWSNFGGPGLAFGGDYNPEQWDRDIWPHDIELMRDAGVTFVSLAIFGWATVQPSPDRWCFDWLDEIMDLLAGGGIAVALATATASPPPWFSHAHPETLPCDADMVRRWPGSRQAWCPSSEVFKRAATTLVEHLAERYASHPALAMWHVSNEYGCHNSPCFCDVCADHFRAWLERRYGAIGRLNDAWGTNFWSQRYNEFAEILPPRRTPAQANPTQLLDYRRFCSDALLDQYLAELAVLRRLTPGIPVTTNYITVDFYRTVDYKRWTSHQDLVSTDHYAMVRSDPDAELSFGADLARGLARGGPWLLMEHATSAVNWQHVNPSKAPGEMLRHSIANVARGADGVGFFQWRASRAGAEKYHSAMVPHAGTDSRVWREVTELGAIMKRLGELRGSRVVAEVAMVWDYEAGWACDQDSHPSSLVRYGDDAHHIHAGLRSLGVTVDVVPPDTDLTAYRLVVVPTLYLAADQTVANVYEAAHAGVDVVVTFFSGITDENDHIRLGGYPGAFRELLGIRVEEFCPLLDGELVELVGPGGDPAGTATVWTEDLTCVDADPILTYKNGPVAGRAAATRRETATGRTWYLGTRLDSDTLRRLLASICDQAGVRSDANHPVGLEVVRRSNATSSWLFVINHANAEAHLPDLRGWDLISDTAVAGLTLEGGAVAVVRESGTNP